MTKLLIVIDMQNDFVTGVLGSPAAAAAIGPIRDKLEEYKAAGHPVLFTMDTHEESDYTAAEKTRESAVIPRHCIKGTDGWRLVPELAPYGEGRSIEKPSFLSPTLAEEIRARYGDDVELTLCGVCTDICVVSNALALRDRFPKARIFVAADCCAGTSAANHAAALAVMGSCLVEVLQ